MKRSLLALAGCLLLFSSCTKIVTGEGPVVTEVRQVAAFNKVKLDGAGTVEIVQGAVQKVTVSGYANLVDVFETVIRNEVLVLKFQSGVLSLKNNIKIVIEVPDIQAVYNDGSGDIQVRNFVNGTDLIADVKGSGDITVMGSSFDRSSLWVDGSGSIKASGAQFKEADITIHGSGNIELTCLQKLKARITGSGNIDYYGNPASADISISGSGKVRKR